ncbi:hypothetical protein EYF80_045194 [Liparis tanakae]|uniref:Uncharacterized protein n=1 Tax=Liparis tanakae TaxID=230148 RepID=A0A4Z2FVD2_9TELE|nr:hypothetical protein EYF80_045194 [Liparis tanakae]
MGELRKRPALPGALVFFSLKNRYLSEGNVSDEEQDRDVDEGNDNVIGEADAWRSGWWNVTTTNDAMALLMLRPLLLSSPILGSEWLKDLVTIYSSTNHVTNVTMATGSTTKGEALDRLNKGWDSPRDDRLHHLSVVIYPDCRDKGDEWKSGRIHFGGGALESDEEEAGNSRNASALAAHGNSREDIQGGRDATTIIITTTIIIIIIIIIITTTTIIIRDLELKAHIMTLRDDDASDCP